MIGVEYYGEPLAVAYKGPTADGIVVELKILRELQGTEVLDPVRTVLGTNEPAYTEPLSFPVEERKPVGNIRSPYSWLVVLAYKEFALAESSAFSEEQYRNNPAANHDRALELLTGRLQPVRDAARFTAAAFAAEFPGALLDIRSRRDITWPPESSNGHGAIRLHLYNTGVQQMTHTRADDVLRKVVAVVNKGQTPRALITASHWLSLARERPVGSVDAFLYGYLTLETLAWGELGEPDVAKLTLAAPEITPIVDGVASSITKAIRVRFRVLAATLFPGDAELHATMFDALTKVRNDLVHGRSAAVPDRYNGVDLHPAARTLSTQYVGAALDHAARGLRTSPSA